MAESSDGRDTGNCRSPTVCSEGTFSSVRVCSVLVPQGTEELLPVTLDYFFLSRVII